MSYQIPPFLKKEGNSLLYNGEEGSELVYYIPESYFRDDEAISAPAYISGSYVSLIGIFDYAIFDKNGTPGKLTRFNFPSIFLCKPSNIEKVKDIKLTKYTSKQSYRLLHFSNGDEVVVSTKVPQILENSELFFTLFFITGNISTNIPYDTLHTYFDKNINLNGADYGILEQYFGMIVSEMARDSSDESKNYFKSKEFDPKGTNYAINSIRMLPKYISPYQSIISENFDEAVMGAVLMSKDDTKTSPLEKIMMD